MQRNILRKLISYLLASLMGFAFLEGNSPVSEENTIIATWKDNKKGAFTLRFDDSRRGCIKNQFTQDKSAYSLVIGAVNVSWDSMAGDICLDDLSISDSLLE